MPLRIKYVRGAGFLSFEDGAVSCYGYSESLQLGMALDDSEIIEAMLRGGIPDLPCEISHDVA